MLHSWDLRLCYHNNDLNRAIFLTTSPSIQDVLRSFRDEFHIWILAGTKELKLHSQGRVDGFTVTLSILKCKILESSIFVPEYKAF